MHEISLFPIRFKVIREGRPNNGVMSLIELLLILSPFRYRSCLRGFKSVILLLPRSRKRSWSNRVRSDKALISELAQLKIVSSDDVLTFCCFIAKLIQPCKSAFFISPV